MAHRAFLGSLLQAVETLKHAMDLGDLQTLAHDRLSALDTTAAFLWQACGPFPQLYLDRRNQLVGLSGSGCGRCVAGALNILVGMARAQHPAQLSASCSGAAPPLPREWFSFW